MKNLILGAVEGVHYFTQNGRVFPIVRGGDGPLSPAQEAERDARYINDCLAVIADGAAARGSACTEQAERAAATALTEDEQRRWDEGTAERDRLITVVERHNAVSTQSQIPAAIERGDGNGFHPVAGIVRDADPHSITDLRFGDSGAIRSQALRALESTDGMEDRHRVQTESLVRSLDDSLAMKVILTSAPAYRSGFLKAVGGNPELLTEPERDALNLVKRTVSLGGTGGYPVPTVLDPTIIDTGTHSTNPFRQVSTIKQITTTTWNGVSSAGVTASWDAELAEVSDDSPTLVQLSIPTFKGQVFVPFSVESEDWVGMEADVRKMIAVAKDDLEGAAFVSGNGTSAPQGVVTALDGTAREIAPATGETFARVDVDTLPGTVQARYRKNGVFIANNVWFNAIKAFETTVAVGSLFGPTPVDYRGDHILSGYPAYESTDMDNVLPNTAATADNFALLFGDFGQGYYIVDRVGLTVELVPHLFHTSNNRPMGARGFLAWFRTGAEVVNPAALSVLSIPTAA